VIVLGERKLRAIGSGRWPAEALIKGAGQRLARSAGIAAGGAAVAADRPAVTLLGLTPQTDSCGIRAGSAHDAAGRVRRSARLGRVS
jgi:hypothetical protein